MPLEFRGLALPDPPGRAIRFAGYPVGGRNMAIVVCEVTTELLRALAGLPDANSGELMGIFEIHKEEIFARCSAKFDAGDYRPIVGVADFHPSLAAFKAEHAAE